jgi:hypothetical protein
MEVKWIGFDMDECIGSVMPLYTFIAELPRAFQAAGIQDTAKIYNTIKNGVYLSERAKETWLLRPAMYDALEALYQAYKAGRFYGAFIFSNNCSQELVSFLAFYCNAYMWRRFYDYTYPQIFKMAVSRDSPCRSPGSLDKTFDEVQRALAAHGQPLLTSSRDLMFFDDQEHILAGEIPYYVRVRPYYNYCKVARVVGALAGCADLVGAEAWARIVQRATAQEEIEGHYVLIPPTVKEYYIDRQMFASAFRSFLGVGLSVVGGKCRHTRGLRRHGRPGTRKKMLALR